MTTSIDKGPAAIRVVIPFVFRHWRDQPALALTVAGGLLGATVADLFMPVFSGHLVDAMTRGPAEPAPVTTRWGPSSGSLRSASCR